MSKYLNDLIKALQAEAQEHQALLKDHAAPASRRFRHDTGHVDRLLQRIKTLQELQVSEARRHRNLLRSAVANSQRRESSRQSQSQGDASPAGNR